MKVTKRIVKLVKKIVEDKKAENILVLDVKKVCNFTSYFIILNGNSKPHIMAIKAEIEEKLKKKNIKIYSEEVADGWVLLDYGDLIIHIFDEDKRKYYNIERIWLDAKVVEF